MNMFQITANLPGLGESSLLQSPSLEEAAKRMNDPAKDPWGYVSYGMGGAFLLPWASRLSGQVSPDDQTVTTTWQGHPLHLRINASGKYAIHGLIHRAPAQDIKVTPSPDGQVVHALIHAIDFGGHWLSSTDIVFTIALHAQTIDITIEAKNVGREPEPMAIGWHPYFAIPSHDRSKALLHVAADRYAETTPSDGLTTGTLLPSTGSPFDFHTPDGAHLGPSINVNFSSLASGPACPASLVDPTAAYGLCVRPISPTIHTLQVYSPDTSTFVAIEPQFNFPDPLGPEWHGRDTGLATLQPGHSAVWKVRLELFRQ
jgi:aldose 1-epimerase